MFTFIYLYLLVKVSVLSASAACDLSPEKVLSVFSSSSLDRDTLPSGFLTTKDLILTNGFGYKGDKIVTEDGYILRVHRIIGKNPGGLPVLLGHGATTTSESFLLRGKKYSLAFHLADAGFDVWLFDRRGNWYSREHVKYKPNTWKFWDFSFHESGYYDLPAFIDYVIKATNHSTVYFIGHSMGTTDFCVMASMRPEYNAKVKLAVLLGPTCNGRKVQELPTLVRIGVTSSDLIYQYAKRAYIYELFAKKKNLIKMLEECCDRSKFQMICTVVYKTAFGDDGNSLNETELPKIASHWPGGTSTKTMNHLSQIFLSGFAHYDYGAKENLIRYQNVTPTSYPMHKVTSPVALLWSIQDPFVNERSMKELEEQLPNVAENFKIEEPIFNHADFILASSTKLVVNIKLIELFKRFM